MSYPEAKSSVKQMLKEAIKIVKQSGEDKLPANFVEKLLTDPKFKKKHEVLKKDGVRNEDIRWWFGMHLLEREMMMKMDEFYRITLFFAEIADGKTIDEATKKVEKYHPIFDYPENTENQKRENKPLPEQLKDRINIYIGKRTTSESKQYKKDIEDSPSFNALIRKEIKAGNL
jgi:hypothetical protein